MKNFIIILLLINIVPSYANSIEADMFVQSTVNRASESLSKNISREEEINGLDLAEHGMEAYADFRTNEG